MLSISNSLYRELVENNFGKLNKYLSNEFKGVSSLLACA